MLGQHVHNIDAKGRLFIPAKFREKLGNTFYLTVGLNGSLAVFSETKWAKIAEKVDAMTLLESRKMRAFLANAIECEPDGQGRILIPSKLRDKAKLEKEVVIAGMYNYVELWNPEVWEAIESEGLEEGNLEDAMGGV